jgi:hypothetical protein
MLHAGFCCQPLAANPSEPVPNLRLIKSMVTIMAALPTTADENISPCKSCGLARSFKPDIFGNISRPIPKLFGMAHVHDQRVIDRALLGREDPRDCRWIAGVGAKSINRFGGQTDQTAVAQHIHGFSHTF